jgi:hypothetical protein
MPGPVRQSGLVNEAARSDSNVSSASINGVASGNALIAVCVAHCSTTVQTGNIVSAYTSSPSNTWTLAVRHAQTIGSFRTEVTIWVAHNVASGNTTGKPTFTAGTNAGHEIFHHFDEWSGVVTSSSVDKTGTVANAENLDTITVPNTATLAQADQIVYCAVGCRWNYQWNGDGPGGAGAAPSTYTVSKGETENSLMVAQSAYKEVSSTAAVGATWTYAQQTGDRGAVAVLATFKKSSTSLRLEIDNIDTTDISGTTGWTIGAWAGSPFQTGAGGQCSKVWTSYSASITSGKLIFPDAPPGASLNDAYNVMGYQPSGTRTLAWCQGVVRAAS